VKRSIIVAASEAGVIGNRGGMPWRLPADLRRFKSLTMGHALIVGRKTYASIGKPLPGRKMIVVTRGATLPDGVVRADSMEAALQAAERLEREEVFIAGGAEIYALALPTADRLYLTRVEGDIIGDTVVPALIGGVPSAFYLIAPPEPLEDPGNSHPAVLHIYERQGAGEPAPDA